MTSALAISDATAARTPFSALVDMSERMLHEARAGRWDAVMELQNERQRRFESFFAGPVSKAAAEQVAAGIRQILEFDRQVMDLGRQGMDELAGAMNDLRSGRRAQQAYGAVGR